MPLINSREPEGWESLEEWNQHSIDEEHQRTSLYFTRHEPPGRRKTNGNVVLADAEMWITVHRRQYYSVEWDDTLDDHNMRKPDVVPWCEDGRLTIPGYVFAIREIFITGSGFTDGSALWRLNSLLMLSAELRDLEGSRECEFRYESLLDPTVLQNIDPDMELTSVLNLSEILDEKDQLASCSKVAYYPTGIMMTRPQSVT